MPSGRGQRESKCCGTVTSACATVLGLVSPGTGRYVRRVPERVTLHVGAPKSGTTYLQTRLWNNRERLGELDVFLPGRRKQEHDALAFWLRGGRVHRDAARRVLDAARSGTGHQLLSSEWFCTASERRIEDLLGELAPAEVHVVLTARRFVASIPSAWSQTLKSGKASELEDFVRRLDDIDPHWNWGTLDPAVALERWRRHLPAERVHVVTVPVTRGEPDELWRRFATACALPSAHGFTDSGVKVNESLTAEGARLLQLLGPALREALDVDHARQPLARWWIHGYFTRRLVLPHTGTPIRPDAAEVALLRERAERTVARLEAAGYDVVGDLADLLDARVPEHGIHPRDVRDAALLELALATIPAMLQRLSHEHRELRQAERRLRGRGDGAGRTNRPVPERTASHVPARLRDRVRPLRRRLGPVARRSQRRWESMRHRLTDH